MSDNISGQYKAIQSMQTELVEAINRTSNIDTLIQRALSEDIIGKGATLKSSSARDKASTLVLAIVHEVEQDSTVFDKLLIILKEFSSLEYLVKPLENSKLANTTSQYTTQDHGPPSKSYSSLLGPQDSIHKFEAVSNTDKSGFGDSLQDQKPIPGEQITGLLGGVSGSGDLINTPDSVGTNFTEHSVSTLSTPPLLIPSGDDCEERVEDILAAPTADTQPPGEPMFHVGTSVQEVSGGSKLGSAVIVLRAPVDRVAKEMSSKDRKQSELEKEMIEYKQDNSNLNKHPKKEKVKLNAGRKKKDVKLKIGEKEKSELKKTLSLLITSKDDFKERKEDSLLPGANVLKDCEERVEDIFAAPTDDTQPPGEPMFYVGTTVQEVSGGSRHAVLMKSMTTLMEETSVKDRELSEFQKELTDIRNLNKQLKKENAKLKDERDTAKIQKGIEMNSLYKKLLAKEKTIEQQQHNMSSIEKKSNELRDNHEAEIKQWKEKEKTNMLEFTEGRQKLEQQIRDVQTKVEHLIVEVADAKKESNNMKAEFTLERQKRAEESANMKAELTLERQQRAEESANMKADLALERQKRAEESADIKVELALERQKRAEESADMKAELALERQKKAEENADIKVELALERQKIAEEKLKEMKQHQLPCASLHSNATVPSVSVPPEHPEIDRVPHEHPVIDRVPPEHPDLSGAP